MIRVPYNFVYEAINPQNRLTETLLNQHGQLRHLPTVLCGCVPCHIFRFSSFLKPPHPGRYKLLNLQRRNKRLLLPGVEPRAIPYVGTFDKVGRYDVTATPQQRETIGAIKLYDTIQ